MTLAMDGLKVEGRLLAHVIPYCHVSTEKCNFGAFSSRTAHVASSGSVHPAQYKIGSLDKITPPINDAE
jgi:hypothetical protein